MKFDDIIKGKTPRNFYFINTLGNYPLMGEGVGNFSNMVEVLTLKKSRVSKCLTEIKEHIRIIPLGYREVQTSIGLFLTRGKTGAKSKISSSISNRSAFRFTRKYCLFCLLLNLHPNNPEYKFGIIKLDTCELALLMNIGYLCDGEHSFSLSFPATAATSMQDRAEDKPHLLQVAEDEQVTNLTREPGVIGVWTDFNMNLTHKKSILLKAHKDSSPLSKEQYQALVTFARINCVAQSSLDFYTFIPQINESKCMMEILATIGNSRRIGDSLVREWIGEYINELLLHEFSEIRTYAKYYADIVGEIP